MKEVSLQIPLLKANELGLQDFCVGKKLAEVFNYMACSPNTPKNEPEILEQNYNNFRNPICHFR